jgi:hypothetical protein
MSEVKRYDPQVGGYEGIEYFGMKQSDTANYVLFSDYDKLKKSHDELLHIIKTDIYLGGRHNNCDCHKCQAIKQAEEL